MTWKYCDETMSRSPSPSMSCDDRLAAADVDGERTGAAKVWSAVPRKNCILRMSSVWLTGSFASSETLRRSLMPSLSRSTYCTPW